MKQGKFEAKRVGTVDPIKPGKSAEAVKLVEPQPTAQPGRGRFEAKPVKPVELVKPVKLVEPQQEPQPERGKFEARPGKAPASGKTAEAKQEAQQGRGKFEAKPGKAPASAKAAQTAEPKQETQEARGRFEAKPGKTAQSPEKESQQGRGKFEAKPPKTETRPEAAPAAQAQPAEQTQLKKHKAPVWLVVTLLVLLAGALGGLQYRWLITPAPESEYPGSLTKEEMLAKYQALAQVLEHENMSLVLYPGDSASHDVPINLILTPAQSGVRVNLAGLEQDLNADVGKVARGRYRVEPEDYIFVDRAALRRLAERTEQEWSQPYLPSFAGVSISMAGPEEIRSLTVNTGIAGRVISANEIYDTLLASYLAGEMEPSLTYETFIPEKLDVEEICARTRLDPVDAQLDETTFEITPEEPGLGVDPKELEQTLNFAVAGQGYTVPMHTLKPKVTAESLLTSLYGHILAEAHTPHTRIDDRTTNLILACAEINGTILMPGEVFSFNETVGERTAARGFREATAYVGGNSVPEIGGGVCQVASSIYYATLQADLPAVERHAHTYLVTYVPQGMDAAIYWNLLDFKFENTSPNPIKIEASVSDGEVHILLRGREWKDYHVDLSYEILDEFPWTTVERYVYDDSYATGDTIVTPYTGYRIATYKKLYDMQGNLLDTIQIAVDRYSKRDKVVAVRRWSQEPDSQD